MPNNNQKLHVLAGEEYNPNNPKTNNQLLSSIEANGGGVGEVTSVNGRKGAVTGLAESSATTSALALKANVGKSQTLTANGAINNDTTTVLVAGGDTFTLTQPTQDGRVITILNNAGTELTFNGHIGGAGSSTWSTPAGNRVIQIMSVRIAPSILTWFIAANIQE